MRTPALAPILLVATVVVAPLQWIRLFDSPIGFIGYFHVTAVLLTISVFFSRKYRKITIETIRSSKSVWIAFALLMTATMAATLKPIPMFPMSDVVRQTTYAIFGAVSGAVLLDLLLCNRTIILAWTAPITLLVFSFFIVYSLQGENPLAIISLAIVRADPNIVIIQLFRRAFTAGSFSIDEVQSNFRHGIVAALLLSAVLSAFATRETQGLLKVVTHASIALIALIVLISMSRSAWLALAIIILLAIPYLLISYRGMVALLILTPLATALLLYVGATTSILALFGERLFSTASYEGRGAAADYMLTEIGGDPVFGSMAPPSGGAAWAHNLIIDYWGAAGLLGLIAAVSLFYLIGKRTLSHGLGVYARAGESRALNYFAAAFLAFPLARFVSAPKGHLFLTQWQAVGFSIAIAGYLVAIAHPDALLPRKGWNKEISS